MFAYTDTGQLESLTDGESQVTSYTCNYLRFRLRAQLAFDEKSWTDILHYESRHSILDVFDTLTVVLSHTDPSDFPEELQEPIVDLARTLEDDVFSNVAYQHTLISVQNSASKFAELRESSNQSFLGNFDSALELAKSSLISHPRYFCSYHLAGLAAAHLQISNPFEEIESSAQRDLLNTIHQWYSAFADRIDAMEQLRRLARFYSGTVLGWGIQDFVNCNDGDFDPLGSDRTTVIASPCPLAQHALLRRDRNAARNFLDSELGSCENSFVDVSLRVLLDIEEPGLLENAIENVSLPRQLHVEAIVSSGRKRFAVACRLLETIRVDHPEYYAVRPDAQVLEATSLFEVEDIEGAAELTASLYAVNPKSIPPIQLNKFGPLICDETKEFVKGNIAWPIIAVALRNEGFNQLSVDRVHDFVSDYIESQGCTLPTELLKQKQMDLTSQELAFMRDCCTTEIMESSFWIENQEKLLDERLAMCETIRATTASPPIGIEGEIGLLMRKLAVLDITQRIERSRIYVDTDRIKERSPESLSDTATRLLATVAMTNRDVNRSLRLLGMPNRDGGNVVLVSVDRGEQLFSAVFERLREQYLFSPELGLDANLSQSIRHGPIISGIRAVFDRSQFVTRKATSGDYQTNKYWLETIGESGTNASAVERAFSQLASSVDAFIRRIRLEEVQITSVETPNGLFDYEFSESDVEAGFRAIEPIDDVEDVFDIALELLTNRTESCLDRVRHQITNVWEADLLEMLAEFLSQIEDVVSDTAKLAPLRTAVTDCSTEISRGLEKIAGWFAQEDKHENKAFTVRSLVKTFEQMAVKGGQDCIAEFVSENPSGDLPIAGIYFRSLWDLFFILFDNALKHDGLESTKIRVDIELEESSTRISVANLVSDSVDKELLGDKVKQLNSLSLDRTSDLLKLRSEGGSGIAKLHKIARYEIGNDNAEYSIKLSFSDSMVV